MTESQSESRKIKEEATKRGISRVVHFTQSRNLPQILLLSDGIRSSAHLKQNSPDLFNPNDLQRIDNHEGHISCSIQYPNFWMYRVMKEREKLFENWAILVISADVLWQSGTLFSPRNAAASGGALLKSGYKRFSSMFDEKVSSGQRHFTRSPKMLASVPTDDQAEVMVRDSIPVSQIESIIVPTAESARLESVRLRRIGELPAVRWIVAPELFTSNLSNMIRAGIRPTEEEVVPQTPISRDQYE